MHARKTPQQMLNMVHENYDGIPDRIYEHDSDDDVSKPGKKQAAKNKRRTEGFAV